DAEQIRLKRFCDKLNEKGSLWILSNSDVKSNDPDNNFFDDLYSFYQINRVWASRSVNANPDKRGKLTELLIQNYPNNQPFFEKVINF
ncbi:MAG: DNA adenine methylase, partial [Prevotellaceae bacterium]|nr:DNA adenine methylase [Prevotellaceae bacterium]